MNEAWEIKESRDTVGKRRGRRFLWTLQTTGRRSKISGVHRIKEERSGRKKERQSWLERGKRLWGGLKVREDSHRPWRGLKMMRGRGGGRRQLLCKCVLAYQSKSIQAIAEPFADESDDVCSDLHMGTEQEAGKATHWLVNINIFSISTASSLRSYLMTKRLFNQWGSAG